MGKKKAASRSKGKKTKKLSRAEELERWRALGPGDRVWQETVAPWMVRLFDLADGRTLYGDFKRVRKKVAGFDKLPAESQRKVFELSLFIFDG
jgi:hypothetical protein